jgi:aminoglycoside 3-N-acetyltransferase
MTKLNQITDFLANIEIPKNKIIVVHARIKTLKQEFNLDDVLYEQISKEIINFLINKFEPLTILVPSYTYTFTKSGVFHSMYSRSETGRFSEETRRIGYYRTPDPIFSFIDTHGYFSKYKVNHKIAFGQGSIFEHLHDMDAVILNIGLDKFIATQRHYAEFRFDVNYRFNKYFQGMIYYDEKEHDNINYEYYVRYLDRPTDGNLPKITKELIREKVLHVYENRNVKLFWLTCQAYMDFFEPRMREDIDYMIK